MRSVGCAVNQALTSEAASIVKQAVALAKRRGHAQVTPLHVATTMLAVSGGLLRVACMQSHSHPLQCKALELCFNVALNRLPASSSSPILGHRHSQYPSISNALVAAFKRAQAHQRRGSAENQQQPQLLAVKIELEQLIISILDDPSVSRVMREAGFSSTQVKSNVEKVVSLELSSQNPHPSQQSKSKENRLLITNPTSLEPSDRNDDLQIIVETLLTSRKRRSFVVVGECISNIESTVKELMNRVDKGGVPAALREVKFITIPPFYSFCNLHKDLVEQKMGELTYLVKSLVEKGVVLYLGDLNWISEYRVNNLEQERSYYCSVEHMIMEIGKLISGIGEIGRFWVMGIATFQTYMRCRNGHNSLETIWRLNPVTIPANSLGLSLLSQSSNEHTGARVENGSSQQFLTNGEVLKLTCCGDCSSKFEAEAENLQNDPTLSNLPPWLKDESRRLCNNNQKSDSIMELSKKWNSYSSSAHKQPLSLERTLTLSSPSPSSSTSCFSFDQHNPNPCSAPNSPSSFDIVDRDFGQKFKEFNAKNLNILCNALERKVPWQREIIPEIAGTILQCRSGMLRRKGKVKGNGIDDEVKEETWLLFLGPDSQVKEKISRYLARIVFGSYSNFLSIGMSNFDSSTNKRGRDEQSCSCYIERFAEAVCENPHRVFLVEDLEKADYCSQMRIKRAIESGRISNGSGEEFSFCDAIVILSCERFSSKLTKCSPSSKQKTENNIAGGGEEERSSRVLLDLNSSFDDDSVEKQFVDDLGILDNVDRHVVFKIQNF